MLQLIGVAIWTTALFCSEPVHHDLPPSEHLPSQKSGVQRYKVPQFSTSFADASHFCTSQFGNDYRLAAIKDQQDLSDLIEYLKANGRMGTAYWIDGAYDITKQKYFWTRLTSSDGSKVYFEDFVMDLFDTDLAKPDTNTRTMISWSSSLKIVTNDWSKYGKFICEYRPKGQAHPLGYIPIIVPPPTLRLPLSL